MSESLPLVASLLQQLARDLHLEDYVLHYFKDFPETCSINNKYVSKFCTLFYKTIQNKCLYFGNTEHFTVYFIMSFNYLGFKSKLLAATRNVGYCLKNHRTNVSSLSTLQAMIETFQRKTITTTKKCYTLSFKIN